MTTKYALGDEVRIKEIGHTGIVTSIELRRIGYPTEPKEDVILYTVSTYVKVISGLTEDDLEPAHKTITYQTYCEMQARTLQRFKQLRDEVTDLIKELDAILAKPEALNPYNTQA